MTDKVAICLCSHNHEKTIERALNSLLNSSHKPDIIVIGDNDSQDHTYSILCELLSAKMIEENGNTGWPPKFEGQLNDIKIIIFKSRLAYSAKILNHCFRILPIDIDVIGFLCCNDWYEPDKISKCLSVFKSHKTAGCVITDYNQYITSRKYIRRFNKSFSYSRLLNECMYDKNFLIRVETMRILKSGFNESLSTREEYELLLRISEVGLIYHLPEVLHNCSYKNNPSQLQIEDEIRKMTIQRRLQNG